MARELHHHSAAQVRGYLDEALRIVDALELDDELRPLAFGKAVDLLAAKQIFVDPEDASPIARGLLSPTLRGLR